MRKKLQKYDEDITSRALKDTCVFEMHDVVETKTKMIGGKEKTYQERTPISTYAIAHFGLLSNRKRE